MRVSSLFQQSEQILLTYLSGFVLQHFKIDEIMLCSIKPVIEGSILHTLSAVVFVIFALDRVDDLGVTIASDPPNSFCIQLVLPQSLVHEGLGCGNHCSV